MSLQAFKIARALREFRKIKNDFPLYAVEMFLAVATQEGVTSTEISKRLAITGAAVSRHLGLLGHQDRHGGRGLGLIEARPAENPKYKELYLTNQGRLLLESIKDIIGGEDHVNAPPGSKH
jgi:DNA-binding MarR family transcriptional regulator